MASRFFWAKNSDNEWTILEQIHKDNQPDFFVTMDSDDPYNREEVKDLYKNFVEIYPPDYTSSVVPNPIPSADSEEGEEGKEGEQRKEQKAYDPNWKTLAAWNDNGRWIIKGSKAKGFTDSGQGLFAYEQTRPAIKKAV